MHINPEANGSFVTLPLAQSCETKCYSLSIALGREDSDHIVTLAAEVTRDQWSDLLTQINAVLLP